MKQEGRPSQLSDLDGRRVAILGPDRPCVVDGTRTGSPVLERLDDPKAGEWTRAQVLEVEGHLRDGADLRFFISTATLLTWWSPGEIWMVVDDLINDGEGESWSASRWSTVNPS